MAWHLDTPCSSVPSCSSEDGFFPVLHFPWTASSTARSQSNTSCGDDEKFSFKDVVAVVKSVRDSGSLPCLCVLFYSCVFPFQKFATELMVTKNTTYPKTSPVPLRVFLLWAALFLTPVFGGMIDRRKAASIMMLGAFMLICVHAIYAIPFIHASWVAIIQYCLGIAFSLVPSAMLGFRGQDIPRSNNWVRHTP